VALHWLPFKFWCQYKLLLYAFKALHGLAPSYLGELIHFYKPARSLRSQSAALIEMHVAPYWGFGRKKNPSFRTQDDSLSIAPSKLNCNLVRLFVSKLQRFRTLLPG
jgi:hypothetical protein